MPHSSPGTSNHSKPRLASKCKLSQHRVGGEAASWHEIHSLEDEKHRSCGEARYAAPRTFPLARVTVGACREHTPMPPVTMPAFTSIAKPFKGDGPPLVVLYTWKKYVTFLFCELPKVFILKCLNKSVSEKIKKSIICTIKGSQKDCFSHLF